MLSAYLLVSHGSSDSRHQAGLSRLAHLMRQQLDRSLREDISADSGVAYRGTGIKPASTGQSGLSDHRFPYQPLCLRTTPPAWRTPLPPASPIVGSATLEATPISLSEQILAFAKRVAAQGVRQVVIVPLFLLAGVHVKEDLPSEIRAAHSRLPMHMRLLCTPHLGGHAAFQRFIASRLQASQAERCLLLAHGSRRKAGNRSVQQLGAILDADVAFWTVPPDLETQVVALMQQGHQHIAIVPYFLFPGSITDAVIRRTENLAEQFPKLSIRLLPPLGANTDLGKVVTEMALGALHTVHLTQRRDNTLRVAERSSITA